MTARPLFLAALAVLAFAAAIIPIRAEETAPKKRVDYLIITADSFADAAKEWGEYRAQKGRRIAVKTVSDIATNWGHERASVTDIKNTIKGAASETINAEFQVLLIGDCPSSPGKKPEGELNYDPNVELPWFITDLKDEQGSIIAGDNFYADIADKDDDLPEIAVGRIPARTIEEVRLALAKVKAYESARNGEWIKRLTFFAGEGHYGPLIDSMIEMAFTQFADEHVDNAYDLRMTYANLDSPYAWVPSKFTDKVAEEANMGSLLLTYLGHGAWDRLDDFRVKIDGKFSTYPILKADDVGKFAIKDGQLPVMLIIACDTGWMDGPAKNRCLGERILFTDNAPVAVIASSRNSHPYSNMIVQKGIVQGIANRKCETLGEAFRYMKRELTLGQEPDRKDLEDMAAMLMPKKSERDAKNRAHLFLYNLMGDPGLKIKHVVSQFKAVLFDNKNGGPASTNEVEEGFAPEYEIDIPQDLQDQKSPVSLTVTLERRRASLGAEPAKFDPADLASKDEKVRAAAEKIVMANHKMANDRLISPGVCVMPEIAPDVGVIRETYGFNLDKPLAPGDYLVKIFALDKKGDKCGFTALPFKVVKKKE